ncbi:MAG TPA: hypothetical protein VK178_16805 [Opitutaceae bacterium]|nr:hypothetical protein [Opitutaceae bacterium]
MGQKYLPTIRDQKAALRFKEQQRRRVQKEQPAESPKPVAPKAAAAPRKS